MDALEGTRKLWEQGQPFVLATVVRIEKPTSAKPGAWATITQDGRLEGWIGGSCAEPTVKREALKALEEGKPRLIRLCPPERMGMLPQEGISELQLTCMSGGTLEIYLEPHTPPARLLIIGHHPIAASLVNLGKAMGYRVSIVGLDLSEEHFPQADEVVNTLDFTKIEVTPGTYIIVASHGNYDEAALETFLKSPAAYISLVASKKRAATVIQYLRDAGLSEAEIARLKYPAGLDLGAVEPQEIALTILAEIIQLRRNGSIRVKHGEPPEIVREVAPTAIDPVCGMTVEIASAIHKTEFEGKAYYFCAAGCKRSFEKNPEKYLHPATASD
jgi:xanthine dehydrogenase accessory factor